MLTIDDIIRVHHIERFELEGWITQRWVRPHATAEGYVFDETDQARIALIRDLQQELLLNSEDSVGTVLTLLDQLYAARRLLRQMEQAIGTLPEPLRAQVRACFGQRREP